MVRLPTADGLQLSLEMKGLMEIKEVWLKVCGPFIMATYFGFISYIHLPILQFLSLNGGTLPYLL